MGREPVDRPADIRRPPPTARSAESGPSRKPPPPLESQRKRRILGSDKSAIRTARVGWRARRTISAISKIRGTRGRWPAHSQAYGAIEGSESMDTEESPHTRGERTAPPPARDSAADRAGGCIFGHRAGSGALWGIRPDGSSTNGRDSRAPRSSEIRRSRFLHDL